MHVLETLQIANKKKKKKMKDKRKRGQLWKPTSTVCPKYDNRHKELDYELSQEPRVGIAITT